MKVLLIDDDPVVQFHLKLFCEKLNWILHCASDYDSGLELARKHQPEVALVDLNLGKRRITNADLDKLKDRTRKVLVISADFLEDSQFTFLQKPFTIDEFRQAVQID
ncbi:MAG: response regulator [Deltaproteobacteria bacterium]|nr:response regulator [Deltaproteobacteria bacterium]MCX7952373.1 response regulator [Deltaproteobacteria bacterium]